MVPLYGQLAAAFAARQGEAMLDGSGRGFFVFVDDAGRITVGGVELAHYETKPASTYQQRCWLVEALRSIGIAAFTHGHSH